METNRKGLKTLWHRRLADPLRMDLARNNLNEVEQDWRNAGGV